MKKSSAIKAAKITLLLFSVGLISMVVWANWHATTFTQARVADSKYVTLKLTTITGSMDRLALEHTISDIEGVSSCSINSVEKTAGIIFYTSRLTTHELELKIKTETGYDVVEKTLIPQKNGCPVSGVKYQILHIRDLFRFRS